MRAAGAKFTMCILVMTVVLVAPVKGSAQTVGSAIEQQLRNSGIDSQMARKIVKGVQSSTGMSLNVPLYDRVDFATFPDARLSVRKLKAPAVLILTPQLTSYIFRGKPDTFQGSFRTYEFHLGKGVHKASSMLFPQVFEQLRALSGPSGISPEEVVVVPRLDEFKFRFGGAWTPKMYVDMKMSVALFAGGKPIFEKTYSVENVKEGTHSLFPNSDQEYRAISKAMLSVLKQAAGEIAALPVLVAYEKPIQQASPVPVASQGKKIDLDAIIFLADTKEKFEQNFGRLTPEERVVALKFLRLKYAKAHDNVDRQLEEINGLIKVAKKLEPVSRNELLDEIRYYKKDADLDLIERNGFDDNIYNFAGDYTETVLDWAGVGITVTKVGVLATGCIGSGGTLCPALAATMGSFEAADVAAEGIGAATEEYFWKSGDATTAWFQGAKASIIEFTAGKIGGGIADAAVGKSALKASQKRAVAAAANIRNAGGDAKLATKVMDKVFVNSMDKAFYTQKEAVSAFVKSQAKNLAKDMENLLTQKKASGKMLKPSDSTVKIKAQQPDIQSLKKL